MERQRSVFEWVLMALLGLVLWWLQDMIVEIRQNTHLAVNAKIELQRSIDDAVFRIKLLESRVEALRSYFLRIIPAPPGLGPEDY